MDILVLTPELVAQVPEHLRLQGGRMGCPFHGSTNGRSLVVFPDGGFYCHKCLRHGVTQENHERWKAENPLKKTRPALISKPIPKQKDTRKENPILGEPLATSYQEWQAGLESARAYLAQRHISIELAEAYGLGLKPLGVPFFSNKDGFGVGKDERVVVPHTTPDGSVVSLYARATDPQEELKHLHLQGNKGIFNAQAFDLTGEPLYVCEGAFDALSLLAVGFKRAIAVFGLSGFRWDWLRPDEREIVLALDYDSQAAAKESGRKAINDFLTQATFHNVVVLRVTQDELGGCKDINEALVAGVLALRPGSPAPVSLPDYLDIPLDPPEKWLDKGQWSRYRDLVRIYAPMQAQSGYSEAQLFSLPTGASRYDFGLLWAAAYFKHTELEFLPDRVVMRGGESEQSVYRAYLKVSGWVSWRLKTATDAL
jgi:hypothetical protein